MEIHEERAESSGAGPSSAVAGVTYDVFISHCGADCKRDFAALLKNELERAGLRCFLDDRDLQLGDDAAVTMCAAMETAKLGVVLVTEGFFKREWCMMELQTFLERGNCIPVFLERSMERQREIVEVCSSGRIWEGFGKFSWSEEEYLDLVRGLFGVTGLRLEALDGYWDACFAKLKQQILRQLGRIEGATMLPQPGLLVGMEEHMETLKGLMGVRASAQNAARRSVQEVGIVGVKGMGGVGKTTLAKRVYNDSQVRTFFGGRVCWLDVNQNPSQEKVCKLQEQILQTLGDADSSLRIASPTWGRAKIRERLHSGANVLICLDDVWVDGHTPLVCKEDLSPGSCILKTTRDANTIEPGGQQYDLDVLSPKNAERLFRATALQGLKASAEVEALICRTLPFCAGLPLALEVVGSAVAKMLIKEGGISQWKSLLATMNGSRLGAAPIGGKVLDVLRTSYDILPDQKHKDSFLFIAGLLPGSTTLEWMQSDPPHGTGYDLLLSELARKVFDQSEIEQPLHRAELVLKELVDRSLVKCELGPLFLGVTVHDLLVDVAVGIIDTKGARFCRWINKSKAFTETAWEQEWEHVVVRNSAPFQLPTSFFDGNRVLSFLVEDCSFEFSNPGLFPFGKSQSRPVNTCRQLELLGCEKLQALPHSIKTFTDLTTLRLYCCPELQSLPRSFGQLRSLEEIIIFGCKGLEHLPSSIGQLKALTAMKLMCCFNLQALPKSIGQLEGLQCLWVSYAAIKSLPESIVQLTGLRELDLTDCRLLRCVPELTGQLAGLRSLKLSNCEALRSLPSSLGNLTGLEYLALEGCVGVQSLPASLTNLNERVLLSALCTERLRVLFAQTSSADDPGGARSDFDIQHAIEMLERLKKLWSSSPTPRLHPSNRTAASSSQTPL